jgi:hypothetical protein
MRAGSIVSRGCVGLVALALIAACAPAGRTAGSQGWRLVHPPEVADPTAPRGRRLVPTAPIGSWKDVGSFPTETACDEARRVDTDTTIDRARALSGPDAKHDLDVRRAVNARCVPADAR